jgi:penicillin-binding protein 1A
VPILSINRARFIITLFCVVLSAVGWIIFVPPFIPEVPESETITDRAGNPLGEILTQGKRHASLDSLESYPFLIESLVALEDRYFFEHAGVSPTGLIRSMVRNMESSFLGETGPTQGGSTLTMGLARNILGINRSRTLKHKAEEMLLALRIEAHFSKNEILQMYLNRVHF